MGFRKPQSWVLPWLNSQEYTVVLLSLPSPVQLKACCYIRSLTPRSFRKPQEILNTFRDLHFFFFFRMMLTFAQCLKLFLIGAKYNDYCHHCWYQTEGKWTHKCFKKTVVDRAGILTRLWSIFHAKACNKPRCVWLCAKTLGATTPSVH